MMPVCLPRPTPVRIPHGTRGRTEHGNRTGPTRETIYKHAWKCADCISIKRMIGEASHVKILTLKLEANIIALQHRRWTPVFIQNNKTLIA